MTKDAFGHEVDFGTVLRVGRRRRDGKYPCSFIYKSSGKRFNKLLTQAQLDETCAGYDEVVGYSCPSRSTPRVGRDEGELREMEALLSRAGFDSKHARRLQDEGMGPLELKGRLATTSGVGSLPYTHGIQRGEGAGGRKTSAQLEAEIDEALAESGER